MIEVENNEITEINELTENDNDYVSIELKGKEIELKLTYKRMKRLKSKFGVSLTDFDKMDTEMMGQILYAASGTDIGFNEFEDELENINLGEINEMVEKVCYASLPKSQREIAKRQAEKQRELISMNS